MKSLAKILPLLLSFAGGLALARAEEAKPPPPSDAEGTYSFPGKVEDDEGGRAARGRAGAGADNLRAMMEKLNLTPAQQKKVAEIRKKYADQLIAARGDRPKLAALMKKQRDEIRALLTPEQQKQFDELPVPARGGAGAGKGATKGKADKKS